MQKWEPVWFPFFCEEEKDSLGILPGQIDCEEPVVCFLASSLQVFFQEDRSFKCLTEKSNKADLGNFKKIFERL